jgi:hypothetical protein
MEQLTNKNSGSPVKHKNGSGTMVLVLTTLALCQYVPLDTTIMFIIDMSMQTKDL